MVRKIREGGHSFDPDELFNDEWNQREVDKVFNEIHRVGYSYIIEGLTHQELLSKYENEIEESLIVSFGEYTLQVVIVKNSIILPKSEVDIISPASLIFMLGGV